MRLVRHVFVLRLVAAVLVASLGLTLAPTAGAQGGGAALHALLNDEDAVQRALDAAHAAAAGEDPVAVFAQAYADAVEGVSAEAVIGLLRQPSMSGVTPPAADEARATAAAGPTLSASVAALVEPATDATPTGEALGVAPDGPLALRVQAPSSRPRAP